MQEIRKKLRVVVQPTGLDIVNNTNNISEIILSRASVVFTE